MKTYYIAYPLNNGDWDVTHEFEAEDDQAANEYAERLTQAEDYEYDRNDWYVLDVNYKNIND